MNMPRVNYARTVQLALATFMVALTCSLTSHAQQDTTSLSGSIKDARGAVVSGATVTLVNRATSATRTVHTGGDGTYVFGQVTPGLYTVRTEAANFKTSVQEYVRLLVKTPATLDMQLEVGAVNEIVTVASGEAEINTRDATIGNAFNSTQITQLPLEGRNVVSLLSLQPGVVFLGENSPTRTNSFGQIDPDSRNGAAGGARSDQANVTLDGVDVNDQQGGFAFTSTLRVTTESVQEFRVVTTTTNADQGRSSGAQVSLVTRGGTNDLHGVLFESHRNTVTSANDFFNNRAGLPRPKLLRNVFGGNLGGSLVRDRVFFFGGYEGRRDASETPVLRTVPNANLRAGILRYRTRDNRTVALTPEQFTTLDPARIGANPSALDVLNQYPLPNDFQVGDGLNFAGFRFNSPVRVKFDTYTARFDYNLSERHTLFWRGNLQNDKSEDEQYLPGQPPRLTRLNNSKGFVAGSNLNLRSNLFNTFRYGLTRTGLEYLGLLRGPAYSFGSGIGSSIPSNRSRGRIEPVHNIVDDVAWVKGDHTLNFGANLRFIRTRRYSEEFSSTFLNANLGYLTDRGASLLPADVAPAFQNTYIPTALAVLGAFPQANASYNYARDGQLLPLDTPVRRRFSTNEYEAYAQDSWRIKSNLTLNYGLRYSFYTPIYEQDGNQTAPTVALSEYFDQRATLAAQGIPQSALPPITFDLSGKANDRVGYYRSDKNNFAPRVSVAYSPAFTDGFLARLTGGAGRTSLRGGFSLQYDRAGSIASTLYDSVGAYGLSTLLITALGSQNLATMPRFQGLDRVPPGLLVPPPRFGFPFQPPGAGQPGSQAIGFAPDANIKTPYSTNFNVSLQRALPADFTVEVAYVGRESRNLLALFDVALPVNLADPASNTTYFQAAQQLTAVGNVPVTNVTPIPYWENIFPGLATTAQRMTALYGTAFTRVNPGLASDARLSATQVAHYLYNQAASTRYTNALAAIDVACVPACSKFGPYAFYNDQFQSLNAWRSVAPASYHAAQLLVRKRLSRGVQFDFNYTLAKSLDWASAAERSDAFQGSTVVNSYAPEQMYAPSDFDLRHQLNANWIAELPFGRNRFFGWNANSLVNALIGGWQLAGIARWTSGFPVSVTADAARSTNPYFRGFSTPLGETPETQNARNAQVVGGPNLFADPAAAFARFGITPPGETGARNNLRGDGLFSLDFGLGKAFTMPWGEAGAPFLAKEKILHKSAKLFSSAARWPAMPASCRRRFPSTHLAAAKQSMAQHTRPPPAPASIVVAVTL